MEHKSGFVTIIGRPNAGKSTLINDIIGQKIAIMSDKAQTTRNLIQGVYTEKDCQIVFIDTPGIHKPHHELGKRLVDMAYSSIAGVDVICYIVDGSEEIGTGERRIIENLKTYHLPVILVINKIDKLKGNMGIDRVILSYMKLYEFQEIIPISAKNKTYVDHLLDSIKALLPTGPAFYPEDMITDHPVCFLITEIIREKVLYFTKEEIPYSIACVIDKIGDNEETKEKDIFATIICERQSQKGIIIGEGGSLLKHVKLLAKKEISRFFDEKINLELWVKVEPDWRNKKADLKNLGFYDEE